MKADAPYDKIISTVALSGMSEVLFSQMKIGGRVRISNLQELHGYSCIPIRKNRRYDFESFGDNRSSFHGGRGVRTGSYLSHREFSLRLTDGRFQII